MKRNILRAIAHRKSGISYVALCAMVLCVSLLFSTLFTFASAVNLIEITRDNGRLALDGIVRSTSIEIVNEIKQTSTAYQDGNGATLTQCTAAFNQEWKNLCLLEKDSEGTYSRFNENGARLYRVTPATVKKSADGLQLIVTYKIYISVYFCGAPLEFLEIPTTITIRARLLDKLPTTATIE